MTTPTQMPESLKVVAYLTTDEEDSPAMLFFNQQEAGNYCALDEQPQELVLRSDFEAALQAALQAALKDRDAEIERLKKDAERLNALESAAVENQWIVAKNADSFTASLGRPRHATRRTLREAIDAAIDSMKGDAS